MTTDLQICHVWKSFEDTLFLEVLFTLDFFHSTHSDNKESHSLNISDIITKLFFCYMYCSDIEASKKKR